MTTKTQKQNSVNEKKAETPGQKLESKPGIFRPGYDPRRNLEGRPLGVENWQTIWKRAVKKYAESNDKTLEDAENELFIAGFEKAKKGDFNFYKDTMDRMFGEQKDQGNTQINQVLLQVNKVLEDDSS